MNEKKIQKEEEEEEHVGQWQAGGIPITYIFHVNRQTKKNEQKSIFNE